MFNKSLLIAILVIAFSWIGYVGFNIVNSASLIPAPDHLFGPNEQLIVVNHVNELDFNDTLVEPIQHESFVMQLLHEPERIQHFYINSKFNKLLLERSKPWTIELIRSYFDKIGLSVSIQSDKTIQLSNNWNGKFTDKYLALSSSELSFAEHQSEVWKYLDKKCSYSLVSLMENGNYTLQNQYHISEEKTSFYASSNSKEFPRVADQELFQDYIPTNLDSYMFYEKNYGQAAFDSNSKVFAWINYGFAFFVKGKDTCFVSDFALGQDPIAILEEEKSFTKLNEHKGTLSQFKVPGIKKTAKLTLEVFNQAVFISSSADFLNQIIGAYETGNTFAQSESKRSSLFQTMPKQVGYRRITADIHETKSFLPHTICSIIQKQDLESVASSEPAQLYQPLRLDGDLLFLQQIPGTDKIIATTANNTVYCLGKNKIDWSKTLSCSILARHLVVGNSIYIPTDAGVIGLGTNGAELSGFPITNEAIHANLYSYIWKGQTAIAYAGDKQFGAFSTTGKSLFQFNHNLINPSDIIVVGIKGELMVHLADDTHWSIYNINRKRKMKQFTVSEGTWRLNKSNNEVSVLGVSKKQLVRINQKNQTSVLIGNCSKLLRAQNGQEGQIYFITQNQTIFIVNENGRLISQFNTTLNNIADASLLKLRNGKTIVGIIDGIANNCYIYRENGNEITKQNYEGSNRIAFMKQMDGSVVMISQSNGYFVRYSLNY